MRQFGLLEGAQQMFLVLFPQESHFRDAGHSVHSSVLLVEKNCPLQIIKELYTLDNNFAIDNKKFRLVQNLSMGEADFNQFMRRRNQLVNAAKIFAREENLTPVLILTMSRGMDEQLKLTQKVVDVADRTNRKIGVTLLRYNVDKSEKSYAQVRLFARKKEDEKFQQVVYVNYKLEEFIYLLDVMNSV